MHLQIAMPEWIASLPLLHVLSAGLSSNLCSVRSSSAISATSASARNLPGHLQVTSPVKHLARVQAKSVLYTHNLAAVTLHPLVTLGYAPRLSKDTALSLSL